MGAHIPQEVLVADEEPHDVGSALGLALLGAVQAAGHGLVEEEVGGHDGGDGPQVHAVAALPGDDLTEELQQSLGRDQHATAGLKLQCSTSAAPVQHKLGSHDLNATGADFTACCGH